MSWGGQPVFDFSITLPCACLSALQVDDGGGGHGAPRLPAALHRQRRREGAAVLLDPFQRAGAQARVGCSFSCVSPSVHRPSVVDPDTKRQTQKNTHNPRNPTARTQRAFAKRHPSITVPVKRIVSSNKASGADATAEGASSSSSSSASRAQALAATGFVFGRATARKYVRA